VCSERASPQNGLLLPSGLAVLRPVWWLVRMPAGGAHSSTRNPELRSAFAQECASICPVFSVALVVIVCARRLPAALHRLLSLSPCWLFRSLFFPFAFRRVSRLATRHQHPSVRAGRDNALLHAHEGLNTALPICLPVTPACPPLCMPQVMQGTIYVLDCIWFGIIARMAANALREGGVRRDIRSSDPDD